MGNNNNQIGSELKFIQTIEDSHFGQIDIFKSEQGHFIMKIKRSYVVKDRRHAEFHKILEWHNSEKSKLIAPIVSINTSIQNGMCIQYEMVEILTEYYNYTLDNLISNKKELEEPQLWFVLAELLNLTTVLRKNKLGISLQLSNVFVTLKGMLCVYIHHVVSLQQSIQFNQFSMGQQIALILLQIALGQHINCENIELGSKQMLLNMSKIFSKYKLLGKIVKELLNRQKSQESIVKQIQFLIQSKKISKISQLKLNKFKYAIPQAIKSKQISEQSTEKKQIRSETKIVEFKPQRKFPDTTKKTRTLTVPSMQNSEIPKEYLFSANPYIDQIKNKLRQKLSKDLNKNVLNDIQSKKKQNELKKQKFLMKKQSLLNVIGSNKQNMNAIHDNKNETIKISNKLFKDQKAFQSTHKNTKKIIN